MSFEDKKNRRGNETMSSEFAEPEKVVDTKPKSAPKGPIGSVIGTKFLNVRKSPDTKAEVIATLSAGDNVTVLGDIANYYKISMADLRIGYVLKGYLNVKR